jgi:hypothetical protein
MVPLNTNGQDQLLIRSPYSSEQFSHRRTIQGKVSLLWLRPSHDSRESCLNLAALPDNPNVEVRNLLQAPTIR